MLERFTSQQRTLLQLRAYSNRGYYDFPFYVNEFPPSVLTGKEGLVELGGHALAMINVDIDRMPSLTSLTPGIFPWKLTEDIYNLSQILPYVPDLEERRKIKA